MNPVNASSNPFERNLPALAALQPKASNPFTNTTQSVFPTAPTVDRGCIAVVQKLMQDVLTGYLQAIQAGPTVPASMLHMKCLIQCAEFEVRQINLGSMRKLQAEDKQQIVSAVGHAWTTIASNSIAALHQMNNVIAVLFSKIMNDHQGTSAALSTLQLLYIMHVSDFHKQIASMALDSLHEMRVDMLKAGNISTN